MTPQAEWLDADSRLAELFREADKVRKPWLNVLQVFAIWVGLLGIAGVIWFGVLRAIGAL